MFKKIIKKIERKNENINILIKTIFTIWIFVFTMAAMAFAGFTTHLDAEGSATIQKHIYDYVYLSHVEVSDSSGGSSLYYSFKDHELKSTNITQSCNNYVTYALTIVNTTPYKAFITNSTVKSMINGAGNNTTSETIKFTDVTLNSTYIEPHSTKTVHLKVMNNCTGTDDQVTSIVEFEYSLYKYFDLTVVSDQADSTISITTQEGTFEGTGTFTHRVAEDDTATYTISKHHYYDSTGTYTMGTLDHTVNVTMIPDPKRDVTVNITNTTYLNSTIELKDSSDNLIEPQAGTKYILNKDETYSYKISNLEYYDATGTYTVNDNDGQIINVTLQEKPWITGTVSNTNRTTAATKTDTNYHPGYYLVEAWGGKGGTADGPGGAAGNVYGVIYIAYDTTVFSTAGGNGESAAISTGGANGGGAGGAATDSNSRNRGSGGGYSAFAVGETSITQTTINSGAVKLIAGGGGGGTANGGILNSYAGVSGGAGGSLSSTKTTISIGTVYSGSDGATGATTGQGTGGSTTGGTCTHNGGHAGSLLQGGSASERGGGGGAGYYGGGGGDLARTLPYYGPGGGGGGSSFVATGVSTTIPSGFSLSSNPSTTGGAIKITWIGYQL